MTAFEAVVPEETRTLVVRLAPGTDLFRGIRDVCAHYGVTCASIDTALGSLRSGTVVCISEDPSSPSGASYRSPVTLEGPLELVSACGTIGTEGDSEMLSIHLHGTLAADERTPLCGHLVDDGNNIVLATVELQITQFSGIRWIRRFDHETGFPLFKPETSPCKNIGEPGR